MRRFAELCVLLLTGLVLIPGRGHAQGVTTSGLTGVVQDAGGQPVGGAVVVAVHRPSGTTYRTTSRADGRFAIANMRVGGPYQVTISQPSYSPRVVEELTLNLGVARDLNVVTLAQTAVALEGITVTGERGSVISSDRTGAATQVGREALATLPTISGRLESVVRLSPQSGGGMSFAGVDPRLNNITVDGSYFNNSFGLGSTPGDRTGVAPISLSAIEQIQINIAPFDVRQGNFVGAAVNTVTRSGTNDFRGSLTYQFRDQGLVGTTAAGQPVNAGKFSYDNFGGWLGGPIVRNKLFFFADYEHENLLSPGTTYRANAGGETVAGNVTRVLASDLTGLSSFLSQNFGYQAGGFQDYDFGTPATRYLAKIDYNINEKNKFSLRYNQLNSNTDVLLSNSSSLGFGSRRTNLFGLNFQGSNYRILENIRSLVGELNSSVGSKYANNVIAGYTSHDESRGAPSTFFPFVDVLESGSVYTSFGTELFTPNNELRYGSFQLQDNFTRFGDYHTLTFGVTGERYHSENVFFPGSQSVYTYNSLADFYADANAFLNNPACKADALSAGCLNRTSPVTLRRFQVRYSNIPGQEKPVQPLGVTYVGTYLQDEWTPRTNVKVTGGIRLDVPFFDRTGYDNPAADQLTFRDGSGNAVRYNTGRLPGANVLWSPRFGFNWDVFSDQNTQLRGGTGVFTGPPAYVWISNQIGNTGVLTGFVDMSNTKARPFNPNPAAYKPTSVTGAPASSYELALTDPDFKFPQVWRSDVALDQRLPFGLVGTAEFIYNRDVNGISYINANLIAANSRFTGADNRPRYVGNNRINSNVANATVLQNQSVGYAWNASVSLQRAFTRGFFLKGAYSYGVAKNTVDPGSIAYGSWSSNPIYGDPNNPSLGYSSNTPGQRLFLAGSVRREYLRLGGTTFSFFGDYYTPGNASYNFSGDLNGDGATRNDLLYIPRGVSEMNFQAFTVGSGAAAKTFTAAQQAAAFDAFIAQDPYLSRHRGEYAQRGAAFLPMVFRADVGLAQELFRNIAGRRNGISARVDILNVGNLLNSDWGVGKRFVTTEPLIVPSSSQGGAADAQGRAQYRLRVINNQLIDHTFESTAGLGDVYRLQFSLGYTFQ